MPETNPASETSPQAGRDHAVVRWYQVVDASDDEAYYGLGGFPTLEEAIRGVEFRCRDEPIRCEYDRDEFVRIEIREHSPGWDDSTKKVWSREWINTYDESKDEYIWSVVVETVST